MIEASRVAGVVLAAGASTRFGSPKALALLGGRPLLQRVLDVAADLGLGEVVVVLGHAAGQIEPAIEPRGARFVLNPDPDAGLSSSLRVGLAAVRPDAAAALILLGDQPMVDARVVEALVAAADAADDVPPVVVPRYAAGGGPNPVLIRRDGWSLANEAAGDRGLGPVLRAHPELVLEVPVPGSNPDIDTPEELARAEQAGGRSDGSR